MRRTTLALLLIASSAFAQTPTAVPGPSSLVYLGTAIGPTRGVLGDVQLANGLAIRDTGTGLTLYVGGYNPTQVIQADVPASFSGKLLNPHGVGSLPCQYQKIWGLAWDEVGQALYQTCHNEYDGLPSIDPTLSRGHFVNGALVSDGQWAFANRSDKMTEGGVLVLPDWFVAAHPALNGLRLASCCGGYKSVVSIGPASMGFAAAAFAPPAIAGQVPTVPLVGYPFSSQGPLLKATGYAERMHRSPDYVNDFGGDSNYPRIPTSVGYTTWADWCQQCMAVIDTPGLSGVVGIWQRGLQRVWYTNTINATAWRYDLVIYSFDDLGKVADGAPQSSIQPVLDVPFPMPGIAQPDAGGHDNPPHVITGIAFEPNTRTLVIGVKGAIGTDAASMATAYLFYRVVDPLKPFTVLKTRETTTSLTIQALSEDDALQRAKQAPDTSWQPASDVTGYAVPKP